MNNIVKINKQDCKYEIIEEGIKIEIDNEEKFIPNQEIFSIRYIRLFKIEIGLYFLVSILAFGLWFVLGSIFLLYTLAQIYFNYRVMLLTSKGQIPLKFQSFNDKDDFIYTLKKTNPDIFSKKRWFQFKR